jgi:D-sedoheptulose 7-phosphate isomerase
MVMNEKLKFFELANTAEQVSKMLEKVRNEKRQAFICGNGGSACNSIHFAEDLMGRGVRAMALLDIGFLTATANDLGYEYIFSRPLKLWGNEGDLLITISASGKSPNILKAIETAKEMKIDVFSFPTNNDLKSITPRTEDIHSEIIHTVYIALQED